MADIATLPGNAIQTNNYRIIVILSDRQEFNLKTTSGDKRC